MSAERKTLFEVKVVTDHDCGNYRIGEIDTDPQNQVREYISQHGEFGYHEMLRLGARILEVSQTTIRDYRHREAHASTAQASP